jgi:hypothetical protein
LLGFGYVQLDLQGKAFFVLVMAKRAGCGFIGSLSLVEIAPAGGAGSGRCRAVEHD